MMRTPLKIVMLMTLSLLFGCGQQGALYFPEDAPMQSRSPENAKASPNMQTQGSKQP